jgi:nicotinic acid mononucleotide adenylyltransferase
MISAPFSAASMARPAIFLIDARTAEVSSTAIRRRLGDGQTIDGLVDPAVQQHIEQHGLYSSLTPGRHAINSEPDNEAGTLHGKG